MLRMKPLFIIFTLLLGVYANDSETDECWLVNCDEKETYCSILNLKDDYNMYENEPINDTNDGEFFRTPKGNVTDIQTSDEGFITALIDGNDVVFKTSKRFENFEYETTNQESDKHISQDFKLVCSEINDDLKFTFKQRVNDTNNYVPFFNRKIYTYQFGMDINAEFVLTDLLPIFVTDIDITDTKLEYSFSGNDTTNFLKVEQFATKNLGKSHYLKLTTLQKLSLPFYKEIIIEAKDKGGEIGQAKIKIIIQQS